MARKKPITAAELLAELSQNAEYEDREARKTEEAAIRRFSKFQKLSAPILNDLRVIGVTPSSLDQLAQEYAPLSGAVVKILLDWFPKVSDPDIKELLVRPLGATEVAFDGNPLIEAFEASESQTLRWAIANTIAEARPTGMADWVLNAVKNPRYGDARQMLTLAVARIASPQIANDLLLSIYDQLPGHVALALGESGGRRELEFLRDKRDRSKGWIRKEIDHAMRAIAARLDSPIQNSESIS